MTGAPASGRARTLRARVALATVAVLVVVLVVAGALVYTLVGGFLQSRADATLVAIRASVASIVTNGVPPDRRGGAGDPSGYPTRLPTGAFPTGGVPTDGFSSGVPTDGDGRRPLSDSPAPTMSPSGAAATSTPAASGQPVRPGLPSPGPGPAALRVGASPSSSSSSSSGSSGGQQMPFGSDGQLSDAARTAITEQIPTGGFIAVSDQNGSLQLFGTSTVTTADLAREVGATGLRRATVAGTGYRIASTVAQGRTVVVASPVSDVQDTQDRLLVTLLVVGLVALPVAGVLVALAVARGLRPLAAVARTADGIADGDLTLRVPLGRAPAEVASVATALNRMLDANETAFAERDATTDRLRRFVADASHELRTPLASVRGYAELLRRPGALGPQDAAMALGRVQAEAIRMTSLVEDLLLLARLDAGRPLRQDVVDLVPMLADCVRDHLTLAGEDFPVTLATPAHARVVGDADRLRQVATNLLANVRAHTPAGTSVEVSVTLVAGAVVWTVADDGPGVPEAERQRVFERFARVDSSRHRRDQGGDAGGSGLGLAIVDAIVASSHGSVALLPPPGFGVRIEMASAPAPV